jgi:glycosyltransferase involved in cell wall biosynthesis
VNTHPPAVSVILPTFNRLQYLRPAVDSVFAQTFEDWELVIADDGSASATSSYLETVSSHPRVRLMRLPHTGNPSIVRNAALRAARGEYIAFMDSDDVWLPRKLEIQLEALRASRCRWSYTALTRVNAAGEVMPRESPGRRRTPGGSILKQLLALEVAVATPAVMAERSLMSEVGGFDEQQLFFEEYDLWLRLNARAEVCAVVEPLVLVRNHEQHYSADRMGVYQARLALLDKVERSGAGADLVAVLKIERAKTAAALAAILATLDRPAQALKMLWRGRSCALQSRSGLVRAAVTAARAIAPAWLRSLVRHYRRGRNESSASHPQRGPLNAHEAEPAQQADNRHGHDEDGSHAVQPRVEP